MRTVIIAEAGVNHNGDINLAKKLIDVAVFAKADYVKFQTFKTENLVSIKARKAHYQIKNMKESDDDSQYNMLKKLELTDEHYRELIDYCKYKGINFLSTGFDEESIEYLYSLGLRLFKIPSGEITNKPYLQFVASLAKEVIISTGMSTLSEIKSAVEIIRDSGVDISNISVLHCNTEYPTPFNDVNLLAMKTLAKELGTKVGYSDHTNGIEVSIAAVALGANIIEKHFTLDRNMEGPDHKASLEPDELLLLVSSIRNIEIALGSSVKQPSQSELKNIIIARKSIHLRKSVKCGEVLSRENLIMLRPGDGISPMDISKIVGKKVKFNFPKGYKLTYNDIE